uniref:SH3 domain-containing protein n=1 Tax=Elaeophora elaphi TaxID=1147741 RepID=A0A158Q785_9BILA
METFIFKDEVDPVYLALKQATGIYGRRGSSTYNFDSATPSPRNLSEASLQDSGFAEASCNRGVMISSTPQLDQSGMNGGKRRPPKLQKQMKSLSLDCADSPPSITGGVYLSTLRSQISHKHGNSCGKEPYELKIQSLRLVPLTTVRNCGTKLAPTLLHCNNNSSGDVSECERSRSSSGPSPRLTPRRISSSDGSSSDVLQGSHVVIHEYVAGPDTALCLGDRLKVVDNGDPDWLYGFKTGDRADRLMSFPSTCVALVQPGEQPMLLRQNVHIPEAKMRLYRDQVVFAQPDSIMGGRVLVRTERHAFVQCPLQYLLLL